MKVQGCRGVGIGNNLQILIDLPRLLLQRLDPYLLDGEAFYQLLSKDLHAANNIALLSFFPFVVGLNCMIQVLVDGPTGEIVIDGDSW